MPNEEDRLPEGFEVISIDEGREYKVQTICISQCWEYVVLEKDHRLCYSFSTP